MSTQQWANIGEDAGAVYALLDRILEHVPVTAIDYVWIFPARRIAIGESIVVMVGAYDDADRRRVITAHFTVSRNRKGVATVNARIDEHGAAPPDAVPRIVQGVLRRLGEDVNAEPREGLIGGLQDRWDELIVELGGRPRPAPLAADAGSAAAAEVGALAAEGAAAASATDGDTAATDVGAPGADGAEAATVTGGETAAADIATRSAATSQAGAAPADPAEAGETEQRDGA